MVNSVSDGAAFCPKCGATGMLIDGNVKTTISQCKEGKCSWRILLYKDLPTLKQVNKK